MEVGWGDRYKRALRVIVNKRGVKNGKEQWLNAEK